MYLLLRHGKIVTYSKLVNNPFKVEIGQWPNTAMVSIFIICSEKIKTSILFIFFYFSILALLPKSGSFNCSFLLFAPHPTPTAYDGQGHCSSLNCF